MKNGAQTQIMAHVGLSFTGRARVGAETHAKETLMLAKSIGLFVRTGTKDVCVAMYRECEMGKVMKPLEFLSASRDFYMENTS